MVGMPLFRTGTACEEDATGCMDFISISSESACEPQVETVPPHHSSCQTQTLGRLPGHLTKLDQLFPTEKHLKEVLMNQYHQYYN